MGLHWQCLAGHQWDGCLCARCGEKRDEEHEWKTVDCRTHCARCGRIGAPNHEWEGCRCRNCGTEKHKWNEGVCLLCGEKCSHAQVSENWESQVFHKSRLPDQVCLRCRAKVRRAN